MLFTPRRHFVLAALALVACGGDVTPPIDPSPQVTIVAKPATTDTVLAKPAQALVVEIREGGKPRPRTIVRFAVLPTTDPKRAAELTAGLATISATTYGTFVVDSTDADGRVKVLVGFGTVAGPTGITFHIPELGVLDTLALTVRPGAPAAMQFVVRDTVVSVGARYSLGATVADRFKNPIPEEPVSFTAGSSMVAVDASGTVTVSGTGRSYVVARAKTLVDTSRMSVVPTGKLVWFRAGLLATSNLDGTNQTTLTRTNDVSAFPHAAPGGQLVAYYEHSPNDNSTLSVVTAAGSVRQLASAGGPAWPRWSPDGQWIYFSTTRQAGRGVSRIRPDGTGLEQIGPVFGGALYNAVGVSPDGLTVVVQDQGTPLLIDIASGTTRRLSPQCGMPQFSPDGQRIACISDFSVRVINRDGSSDRVISTRYAQTVGGVEWSPDGNWLLVSGISAPELISLTDGAAIVLSKLSGGQITQASFIP